MLSILDVPNEVAEGRERCAVCDVQVPEGAHYGRYAGAVMCSGSCLSAAMFYAGVSGGPIRHLPAIVGDWPRVCDLDEIERDDEDMEDGADEEDFDEDDLEDLRDEIMRLREGYRELKRELYAAKAKIKRMEAS